MTTAPLGRDDYFIQLRVIEKKYEPAGTCMSEVRIVEVLTHVAKRMDQFGIQDVDRF
jgi:hypothetical protein